MRYNFQTARNEKLQDFSPHRISHLYKAIGRKYSLLFLCLAHATLISSYIPSLSAVFEYWNQPQGGVQTLPNRLPYFSWMPFSYDTPAKYLLAVAYQAGNCLKKDGAEQVKRLARFRPNVLICVQRGGHGRAFYERAKLHRSEHGHDSGGF